MGGVPKVCIMNKEEKLVLAHWDMVDCLMDEVVDKVLDKGLHGPEFIESLFHEFASHDKRFHNAGFFWQQASKPQKYEAVKVQPGGYMYYKGYYGEAAIAAFLGMDIKGEGPSAQATVKTLEFIYRRFEDKYKAREWLHWHIQKMHGWTCKARDFDKGCPRRWPDIAGYGLNKPVEDPVGLYKRPK